MGERLCREHFLRFFDERAKKELAQQGRLPRGTVAVALSGGKDSVSALHFVHGLAAKRPDVRVVAVTVDEGISGYRDKSLEVCRELTERIGVEWRVIATRELAGYTIDDYAAGRAGPSGDAAARLRVRPPGEAAAGRPSCGPCGVFRRVGVNALARAAEASVVVTGHNLDDMAQTVLMNVLGADVERLGRMAPHAETQDGLVPRRVPFRTIPEKEVLLYALLHGLPIHHDEECPYAARAQRFALRDQLWQMEARAPGTRHRLVRFQERVAPLVRAAAVAAIGVCASCGAPTGSARCRACEWKATA
jgi:uncharacterized protein (TIGR00269 family)